MKNDLDGGEAVLEAFRRLGCDYIVSSSGSEWSPLWEAMARQKTRNVPGPTYIETWHETLAVNVAAGYTLMTGRPQAVLLHAAVGMLQGVMGIHGALQAEIPMLVMSGESQTVGEDPDLPIESHWYSGISVGGIERLVSPVVKWARPVTSPFTIHDTVIRAGELAQRQPTGPVYLSIALEHMLRRWTPPEKMRAVPAAPKVYASANDIGALVDDIARAKNPVVVAEIAGKDPAVFLALADLADQFAIPVISGRAMMYANFPTDHPLYLGVAAYQHLKDADLVLLVGGRAPWYPPRSRPTAGKIVVIQDNPIKDQMFYQNLHADQYLEGDAATTLRMLTEGLRAGNPQEEARATRRERWRRERDKLVSVQTARLAEAAAGDTIDALAIAHALREAMPKDTIYLDETVVHSEVLRQYLPWTVPQSYFRPYGGLGQGMGYALGMKLAKPERTVALLVGDGSFLYNPVLPAFGAARQYELPILVMVVNNRGYQQMRKGHLHHYPDGIARTHGLFHGVDIKGFNYEELGRSFDFYARRVERPSELPSALKDALKAMSEGRSALLNVVTA